MCVRNGVAKKAIALKNWNKQLLEKVRQLHDIVEEYTYDSSEVTVFNKLNLAGKGRWYATRLTPISHGLNLVPLKGMLTYASSHSNKISGRKSSGLGISKELFWRLCDWISVTSAILMIVLSTTVTDIFS